MIKNYLKVAFRNFSKHKLFSFINLVGLTVGLGVCLLILLFVRDELSYDRFHSKADRILLFKQFEGAAVSGSGFAQMIESEITQVEETARLIKIKALIGSQTQSFYENDFYFADSTVFQIFDFPLTEGNPNTALIAPNNLVISETMAQKYFPNENPIGKTLEFGNQHNLVITGVMKSLPHNSHLSIDFLCSFQSAPTLMRQDLTGYWDNQSLTYLLLSEGTQPETIAPQIIALAEKTNDPNAGVWQLAGIPVRDIYLRHRFEGRIKAQNAIENVWIFSIVAVFILALACFNYVSLVTARSSTRAREVGVRKVLGAKKNQLLLQFLSESGLVLAIATLFALVAVQVVLPTFNQFINRNLELATLFNPKDIILFLSTFALLSLIAGSYPAFVLSSFKPVAVLKNAMFGNMSDAFFRKVLVLLQFAVSIVMIVATIVVVNQLSFIQNKDLGYQRDQILNITFQGDISQSQKQIFKKEMQGLSAIKSVSLSNMLPGQGSYSNKLVEDYVPEGKNTGYQYITADENFLETFGIAMQAGRYFDATSTSDKKQFLVNQAMLEYLEWGDGAIGKEIGYYTYQYTQSGGYEEIPIRGEVIGVVKNYHQSDLKSAIYPMLFKYYQGGESEMAIKIAAGQARNAISAIQEQWKSSFPAEPFTYQFLDESFEQTYANETKTAQVFAIFAALAIFISCLGLLGLVAFAAERRTKEIGVRKVLGASVMNIVGLLSKDFIRLVIISAFIAFPIAWWAMGQWLERFAYRVDLSWWIFALAGLIAVLIALLTVSSQAIRAAVANPVKAIRTE